MQAETIREAVRQPYGAIAMRQTSSGSGCCGTGASCCGPAPSPSRALGYSDDDLAAAPDGGVFAEAFRVLAPGGHLAISDIVALAPSPACCDTTLLSSCCPAEEKSECCGAVTTATAPVTCGCGQSAIRR